MKEDLIAALTDIGALIIQCSNPVCQAQIKVPVGATIGNPSDSRVIALAQCPVCTTNFDSTLRSYVEQFVKNLYAHKGMEKISILLRSDGQ